MNDVDQPSISYEDDDVACLPCARFSSPAGRYGSESKMLVSAAWAGCCGATASPNVRTAPRSTTTARLVRERCAIREEPPRLHIGVLRNDPIRIVSTPVKGSRAALECPAGPVGRARAPVGVPGLRRAGRLGGHCASGLCRARRPTAGHPHPWWRRRDLRRLWAAGALQE